MKGVTVMLDGDVLRPNAAERMQGEVIQRSISKGETVGCYYSDAVKLVRAGDVPSHSGDFFVDSSDRMYFVSGGKLYVADGITGDVIESGTDAWGFYVYNGGECCAYKSESGTNTWVVIYPDGTRSGPITFSETGTPMFGYRSGVLGAAVNLGGYGGAHVYSYQPDGTLTASLVGPPVTPTFQTEVDAVWPIDSGTVGLYVTALVGYLAVNGSRYYVSTDSDTAGYLPWYDDYGVNEITFLGAYGDNGYGLCDVTGETNPYRVVKWSLSGCDGETEVQAYADARTYFYPVNTYGHMVRERTENGSTVRELVDISTMQPVFTDVLTSSALASSGVVRENDGVLWIEGSGVYEKQEVGWLMYPTTAYPRSAPFGKLGYAVDDYALGAQGTAIVLFE